MIPITPSRWPQIGPSLTRAPWRGVFVPPSSGAPTYARTFNGTDQYFSIADNADLSAGNIDVTFFLWAYVATADNGTNKGVLSKGDPLSAGGEYLAWLQNSAITWCVRLGDDSNYALQQVGSVTHPLNAWFTLELVHDATANELRAYINGSQDAGAPSISAGILDAANPFWVGRTAYGYMKGSLARIGMWKRLLTADERTWLNSTDRRYADLGQPATNGSDLLTDIVSYWDGDEASGNLIDAHSGNDLTANESPGQGGGP